LRKLRGKVVVWPVYFDASKTRSEGRRLPKRFAVDSPRVEEILEVSRLLGLNPELNAEARYPKGWWTRSGYVILDKLGSKSETLEMLAKKMSELRKLK